MIIPSIFPSTVRAQFTTRSGGVSEAPFSSLNLGLSTADASEHVLENRRIAAAALGLTPDRMAIAGQVHGCEVRTVDQPGLYPGFDGLVTKEQDLVLSISAADCAAILIADSASNVIGACHAGWRGHVGGVVDNTILEMTKLGASQGAMVAYVSPCISAIHFEVGEEVAAQFAPEFVVRSPDRIKPHINLSGSIVANLVRCGIPTAKIECSPSCTFAASDLFFSHRAQHGTTGRMMGMICMPSKG